MWSVAALSETGAAHKSLALAALVHRRVQELICHWLVAEACCFAALRNQVLLRGGVRGQAALHG